MDSLCRWSWTTRRRVQACEHVVTAADTLPDDLRQALEAITRASGGA